MLSRMMEINLNGTGIGNTPMLVPSFSSRLNINICEIIEIMSKYISTPILISAYDLFYSDNFPSIDFPDLIFIDSGGYECAIDNNISEIGYYNPESFEWNEETHLKTLSDLYGSVPTAIISYDHPTARKSINEQIMVANNLFEGRNNVLKEILIKAEEENSTINVDNVIKNIDSINSFDILGFTEKELGDSVFDRMLNISKIRQRMDEANVKIPIHIFGSLDTITTPLYYFSGADIFDGLSWLRFTYHEEGTFYAECMGPKIYGIHEDMSFIKLLNIVNNYRYLLKLKSDLETFCNTGNFNIFKNNSEFFEETCNALKKEMEK